MANLAGLPQGSHLQGGFRAGRIWEASLWGSVLTKGLPWTGWDQLFYWVVVAVIGALGPINQAGKLLTQKLLEARLGTQLPVSFVNLNFPCCSMG